MAALKSNDLFSTVFRVKGGIFCPFRSGHTASGEIGATDPCCTATELVTIKQPISKLSESATNKTFSRKLLTFIRLLPFRRNLIFLLYQRGNLKNSRRLRTGEGYIYIMKRFVLLFLRPTFAGWLPAQDMIQ